METRVREGRTALAITLFLVATLTVPAVLLGNPSSSAQQAQQPSPSGTGPAIQLYNPSDYSTQPGPPAIGGPQVSDEPADQNGGDAAREYHFTASVANLPPQPLVEFFLVQGQNPPFFLGQGTFEGPFGAVGLEREIPDTFTEGPSQADPSVDTSSATVRAILYSNNGANEVARDDQVVRMNQKNRPSPPPEQTNDPEHAAETVEITSPTNGDEFGFYRRPSGGAVGIVEVEWSNGTDEVGVFYTTSPPDVDPTWKDCGTREPTTGTNTSESNAQDGVRCTLVDGDQPEAVTGVGAIAYDNQLPQDQQTANSGDAHRVRGYSQTPTAVAVEDDQVPAATVAANGGCTELLFARVSDQNGRPIAGINVDVHARGPNDNLAFATHADEQDDFDETQADDSKAPDNHPTEPGRRCSSDGLTGAPQGVHAAGGGQPDRKHIETAVQTDDDGEFIFQLWSDAEGATIVTAWAENVDDDRYCGDEVAGSAVITWGSGGSALPPETAEPPPCPNPSPSSPSSPTSPASPTPTPSPSSPSPSQSPTGSPSPSQSTPTATPTPSPTPPPTTGPGTTTQQQAEREVSLEASESRKTFGKTFTLSGTVSSSNTACVSGVNVDILRDVVGGASEFVPFEQEGTSASGTFSINVRADVSANYVAQVDATTTCGDAASSPEPVLVRVKVILRTSDGKVRRGQRVRLTVLTRPCPATAGDRVLLFRAIEGQFGKSGKKQSNDSCKATFRRRMQQSSVFQGRWPKQTPEFIAGTSRSKAVRVTR